MGLTQPQFVLSDLMIGGSSYVVANPRTQRFCFPWVVQALTGARVMPSPDVRSAMGYLDARGIPWAMSYVTSPWLTVIFRPNRVGFHVVIQCPAEFSTAFRALFSRNQCVVL